MTIHASCPPPDNHYFAASLLLLAALLGRQVVEIGGQRILLAADNGAVKAVSNKCSHLGLPLVGKTALLQGEVANG